MNIFPHNKDKKKDDLMLVFDIGSSSVGGALFRREKSGLPKIFFSVREPIVLKQEFGVDEFLTLTLKALGTVVNRIYLAGFGAPSNIFCILSSPWYISQTRVINFSKNTPFVFNTKLADSLIQKEINLFKEEHLVKYANTQNSVRLIEFKNIKVMLNGYETPNPLNQKGRELEMTVFISMSPEKILSKIEETINQHFHFKEIKFSSFMMTFFTIMRDLNSHQENFLLIDVGGEVTDISMIKKNILRELISFPLGRNFIIRGVASLLKCSLGEAESYLSLMRDEHADISVIKRLEPVISKLKTEWLQKFQESLANLSNDISIPATIYLAVDKDFVDLFCQIIKTEQFNQYTLTESKFEVIILSSQMFQGMAIFGKDVVRDPALITDVIYINRFLNSPA